MVQWTLSFGLGLRVGGGHVDVAREHRMAGTDRVARLPRGTAVHLEALARHRRGQEDARHRVAAASRPDDGLVAERRDPDRRMRLLQRLWPDRGAAELVEAALVLDFGVLPATKQEIDPLFDARPRFLVP